MRFGRSGDPVAETVWDTLREFSILVLRNFRDWRFSRNYFLKFCKHVRQLNYAKSRSQTGNPRYFLEHAKFAILKISHEIKKQMFRTAKLNILVQALKVKNSVYSTPRLH